MCLADVSLQAYDIHIASACNTTKLIFHQNEHWIIIDIINITYAIPTTEMIIVIMERFWHDFIYLSE